MGEFDFSVSGNDNDFTDVHDPYEAYPGGEIEESIPGGVDSVSSGDSTDAVSEVLSSGAQPVTVSGSDSVQIVSDNTPVLEQLQVIHHDLTLIIVLLLFFFAFHRIRSAVSGITGRGLE